MMFAVITPALITGAFVERVRFKSFLLFSLIWATLVYDPLAHWVWARAAGSITWGSWISPAHRGPRGRGGFPPWPLLV